MLEKDTTDKNIYIVKRAGADKKKVAKVKIKGTDKNFYEKTIEEFLIDANESIVTSSQND